MTVKPKPRSDKPTLQVRVRAAAERHPVITLSSVALIVSIIGGAAPVIAWAIDRYETRAHAGEVEANLHRALAWSAVQAIKTEVMVSRNRVNDCDIAEQKQAGTSSLERAACAQYRAELADAAKRFDDARRAAMELSK
jgi:hypothetical protein